MLTFVNFQIFNIQFSKSSTISQLYGSELLTIEMLLFSSSAAERSWFAVPEDLHLIMKFPAGYILSIAIVAGSLLEAELSDLAYSFCLRIHLHFLGGVMKDVFDSVNLLFVRLPPITIEANLSYTYS